MPILNNYATSFASGQVVQVVTALGDGGGNEIITDTANAKVLSLACTITPRFSTSKLLVECFMQANATNPTEANTINRFLKSGIVYGNTAAVGSTHNGTVLPGALGDVQQGILLIASSTANAQVNLRVAMAGEYSPDSISAITFTAVMQAVATNLSATYINAAVDSLMKITEIKA